MKDPKNVRSRFTCVHLWVCVLALASVSVGARAQAVPATATGGVHPYSLGGNTYTFSGAQATAANAAKYSYAPAANGAIYTTNVASIPSPSGGAAVPVTVNGSIPKAAAAAAIGRFALKATGVIGVLQVGVGLYDLAKELGFDVNNSSGAVVVTKPDPNVCVGTSNCTFFTTRTYDSASPHPRTASATKVAACDKTVAEMKGRNSGLPAEVVSYATCDYRLWSQSMGVWYYSYNWGYGTVSVAPVVGPSGTPSSVQALTDAVAAKASWPPESAIARVVRDAVKSGESVAVDPVSVTGPASVPAARTVTNNGTSTTTSQTTNNYNYAGSTVTVTNVTTSSTVNNTSGATEAHTTTTTEPVVEPEPEETPDPCIDNPTRAGCAEIGTAPAPEVMSKASQAVSVTAAAFASSNGCPPPISMVALGRTYALSYQPICDRLVYVKVLFLAMAGVGAAFILSNSFKV
jgi:hypothetical protein